MELIFPMIPWEGRFQMAYSVLLIGCFYQLPLLVCSIPTFRGSVWLRVLSLCAQAQLWPLNKALNPQVHGGCSWPSLSSFPSPECALWRASWRRPKENQYKCLYKNIQMGQTHQSELHCNLPHLEKQFTFLIPDHYIRLDLVFSHLSANIY